MEPKRKLMAAIMGAISAYIEMEQQPFPPSHEAKPEPEVSHGRFPDDKSAIKAQKT